MSISLYKNNDWIPTVTLTWPTTDQRDERPFTAADAVTEGDPEFFLSRVDNSDTELGDADSPSDFEVSATPTGGTATDGEWELFLDASVITADNCDGFFVGNTAYLHIRVAGGSRQILAVPYETKRYAIAA